ncbi:MAG: hypothetical protein M3Q19_13220 [Pseudomonadota bacterium]|nr:hypothetical protein [Pseudomonadota bacterium]
MRALLLISAAALAACQAEGPGNTALVNSEPVAANPDEQPDRPVSSDDPQPASAPEPIGPTSDCPIVRSADWHAHVDAMPGPNDNPRLIVSGKVTVATGGYKLALRMGQVAESYPVQVTVYLDAVPPAGPTAQALETREVRGAWRSEERVGSLTVRCGRRILVRLANIETAS